MPDNVLTCVIFPDLLPWEKEAVAPLVAELSARHRVTVVSLPPSKPTLRSVCPDRGQGALWIVSRHWERAARWSREYRGPVFISALSLTRTIPPLSLLFLHRLFPQPQSRFHLIAHSPINLRFFREMERMSSDQTSFLHLPCPEGEPIARSARPVTVGALARFASESNLNFLMNVAHYVVRRNPDVRFRFLGSGGLHEHLVRMTRDLQLEGHVEIVKGEALHDVAALDLLLYVPLRADHFIPVLTAGSLGIPVLAHELTGLDELIADGRDGFVVPVNETKPMAELVLRMAGDPQLRFSMGSALRARLRERYLPELLVGGYERLFFGEAGERSLSAHAAA